MAKRPTITTVDSGYTSQSTINTNFENVRDQFDNTLSLDGSTPNSLGADLDMNNNDILNAKDVNTANLYIGGTKVVPTDVVNSAWAITKEYDTVAELLADTATYTAGLYFHVIENDFYYKSVASGGDVTNAGSQQFEVLPGDNGYNVKAFGAVGDGVTDDVAAIQAAHAASRVVMYPKGTYLVSATISITQEGAVAFGSNATIKPSTNLPYLYRSQGPDDVVFDGLTFASDGTGSTTALRIEDNGSVQSYRARIENCTFQGWQTPIRLLGIGDYKVLNNFVSEYSDYGMLCSVNGSRSNDSGVIAGNTLLVTTPTSSHQAAIYVKGNVDTNVEYRMDAVVVTNNVIDGGYYSGVRVERSSYSLVNNNVISNVSGTSVGFAVLFGVGAQNCMAEANTCFDCDEGLTVDTSDTVLTPNVTTHNNQLFGNTVHSITRVGLRVNTGALVTIEGNKVRECQNGIQLSSNTIGTQDPDAGTYRSGYNHNVSGNTVERCTRGGIVITSGDVEECFVTDNVVRHCNQEQLTITGGIVVNGGDGHRILNNVAEDNYQSTATRGDYLIDTSEVTDLLLQGNRGDVYFLDIGSVLTNVVIRDHDWHTNFPWVSGGQFSEQVKTANLNGSVAYHFGSETFYANPNGGDITLDVTTPLAAGYEGQRLTLVNVHGTNNLIVPTGGNVSIGSNLTIAAKTAVTFVYHAALSEWLQTV